MSLLRGEANEWTSGFELVRLIVRDALMNDAGGLAWVNRVNGQPREIIRYRNTALQFTLDTDTGERFYTRTEATMKKVKEIASAIADETDAHVEVEGKYGKIKDGDAILRMRMPFAPSNEGGTLLDFDNVADQIQKVYLRFVEDGKITAQ